MAGVARACIVSRLSTPARVPFSLRCRDGRIAGLMAVRSRREMVTVSDQWIGTVSDVDVGDDSRSDGVTVSGRESKRPMLPSRRSTAPSV